MSSWRWIVAACVLLAMPTAFDPGGAFADPAYLTGLCLIVAALWWGTLHMAREQRAPWLLICGAGSCWLIGDVLQRVLDAMSISADPVGAPDVFWLASYPLLILAVLRMIHARGLPAEVIRSVRIDVLVIGAATAAGSWRLLIEPALGEGEPALAEIVHLLYPLGDITIFALAITLVVTPGSRGPVNLLVVSCLGLTLPLDLLFAVLPQFAPGFNVDSLDGGLLVVNSFLGAAALHPARADFTRRATIDDAHAMYRLRVVLLGTSLCTVSVISAVPGAGASTVFTYLVASVVVSITVVVRFYRAVGARDAAEAKLTYQANHDQLTGVANRSLLMDRLSAAVRQSHSRGEPAAIVFVDLDGFKWVNDTWGHPAGDEVLRVVADRLSALVRPTDTVARVGGDEFVILCSGINEERAEQLGYEIRAAVSQPIAIHAGQASVGASVGVLTTNATSLPGEQDTDFIADDLLRHADLAMYQAKRAGGGVQTTRQIRLAS